MVSCAGHRTELSSFLGVSIQKGTTMNATIQNPFLTLDVNTACDEARVLYLDTLARMQQNGGQPVDWLERLKQKSRSNLVSVLARSLGDLDQHPFIFRIGKKPLTST